MFKLSNLFAFLSAVCWITYGSAHDISQKSNDIIRKPHKVFIIAEVSLVHDGSLGNAKCLIDAAAEAGVDAIKFQTHIAQAETTRNFPGPLHLKNEPRYTYLERTSFSQEQWLELKKYAEKRGLTFASSPFSIEAVEMLERIGVTLYKIPSGEVTNLPMHRRITETGKPVILSSGMSNWEELDAAVKIFKGRAQLTVVQCTSLSPCPYDKVGLNVMAEIAQRYSCPVGLSDNTSTIYAPIAAAALGASVIQKRLTLSRRMYGSDAKYALESHEMAEMVRGIRAVEVMLNNSVNKNNINSFKEIKRLYEKSVVAIKDIQPGEILTVQNIALKKPGNGIPPNRFNELLGQCAKRFVSADSLLTLDDIAGGRENMPVGENS